MSNLRLPILKDALELREAREPRESGGARDAHDALDVRDASDASSESNGASRIDVSSSRSNGTLSVNGSANGSGRPSNSPNVPVSAPSSLSLDGGLSSSTDVSEAVMQVGDLARESGKTVRAIHLYEELELLKPAARSKGRYRLYGPEALVRIRWIGKLQDLGFSLTDIKTIVRDIERHHLDGGTAPGAMVKVREVYRKKLDETRTQIARLHALEHEVLASLRYLEACGSVCEPDRLVASCQSCAHHSREEAVPDLVAGFRS